MTDARNARQLVEKVLDPQVQKGIGTDGQHPQQVPKIADGRPAAAPAPASRVSAASERMPPTTGTVPEMHRLGRPDGWR